MRCPAASPASAIRTSRRPFRRPVGRRRARGNPSRERTRGCRPASAAARSTSRARRSARGRSRRAARPSTSARRPSVDTVAAEVGISKRTLYNYYPSKDALIEAYLSRRFRPVPLTDAPPAEQILANFERLERSFANDRFRGCPFVNAVAELKQPGHAANRIAVAFKDARR